MSTIHLPDRIILPRDKERYNLAIATIVIYGIFLPVTWVVEYAAAWKSWSSKRRRRRPWRVGFKAFIDFLSLLCLIRIIGNALYLAFDAPTRSVFIVQTLFSSLGFLPLLMKLIFVLGRIVSKSAEDGKLKMIQHGFIALRVALLVGVILIIIGACILFLPLWKAGSIVLTVAFAGIAAIHVDLLLIGFRGNPFDQVQRRGLAIAATALPPIVVRAAYLVMIQFDQDEKYSPILGDPAYLIGMVLAMEVLVMSSLLTATVVSEQLLGGATKEPVSEDGNRQTLEKAQARHVAGRIGANV